jgi:hypothetical protein
MRRTTILISVLTLLLTVTGTGPRGGTAVEGQTASDSAVVYMQIVAHEDDDFLFMNPDLRNQIAAGLGTVTVYITAGQADGAPGMCRDIFATARQRGVQAAYAQMAGVSNRWTRDLFVPDAGVDWPHTAERYTLDAAPHIRLIFLNLPDGGATDEPYTNALADMFEDPTYQTDTIVPSCGPPDTCVHSPSCNPDVPWQNYTRAEVLNVLGGLLTMYQPHVVRALDPQPFQKAGPPNGECPVEGYEVCFDNTDHTAAARFVNEALAQYHGPNGKKRYTVTHYKGYSFVNYPRNLGTGDYNDKRLTGDTYDPYDPNYFSNAYDSYYRVMYERYPGSTTWIARASNGRLIAVSVEDRRVKLWSETSVGGSWTGPTTVGGSGSPIAPHLTVIKRPDGRLQLFALRIPLARERWQPLTKPLQQVITTTQMPGSMSFGQWTNVGSPDRSQFVGVPTAAVDGAGRIFVFAKSSAGKVAYARSTGSGWSAWAVLNANAQDILDGIAAITRNDGIIEAFATSRSGLIQRYVQSGTGFVADLGFPFAGAASAPTAAHNQDGRLEIFYREAQTSPEKYGRVVTAYVTPSGEWAGPEPLYGDAGVGPVAAIRRETTGHIMLFERNTWGGISTTRQINPNDIFALQWQILGGYVNEYPAAATDGAGRVVLVVKGADGKLYIRREVSAAQIGNFGNWTLVGK